MFLSPKELTKAKSARILLLVVPWVVFTMYYYSITYRLFASPTTVDSYQYLYNDSDNENFLINTPGCRIPNYMKTMRISEAAHIKKDCGHRAVFVEKISNDMIQFRIDEKVLNSYKHKTKKSSYNCCFAFAFPYRDKKGGNDYRKLRYTTCNNFNNGTKSPLREEIITVTCVQINGKRSTNFYEDAYMIVKKEKEATETGNKRWNILVIGMDTMSRARVYNSMPRTVRYLADHDWLDYKGYQKVGYNTFPNIASLLTGKDANLFEKTCYSGMDGCNKQLIWSELKQLGYKTAYGEDFLRLPDTFSRYDGFINKPTDHYMRPLFLTGETTVGNTECASKLTSTRHILDYASDFAKTYMNDSFFGFFWINSYSHNSNNNPKFLEDDMINFFKSLDRFHVMDNTFIFFVSDHGLRTGPVRLQYESYYDERLPMLFMWVPPSFRKLHTREYKSLKRNQYRLVSPFDLHLTMWDIHRATNNSASVKSSEACPQCRSLMKEISPDRRCVNAGVNDKWCSCHQMAEADLGSDNVNRSVAMLMEYLQNRSQAVETVKCTECAKLELHKVHRVHTYEHNSKKFYVIALYMVGDVGYETTVADDNGVLSILQPTYTISTYNTRSSCTATRNGKEYCICKTQPNCHKKPNR